MKENYCCHLDPDIRKTVKYRDTEWEPAFGQESAALTHLKNQGVGIGDLFLFFGWFRQTEYVDGQLSYKKDAPDLHVIYGYFQVGKILDNPDDVPQWLGEHPHVKPERWERPNIIYLSSPKLGLYPGKLPGTDCLRFSDKLVLTKEGCKRSVWNLPRVLSANSNQLQPQFMER
ncbi:MAG: hypothetical protein VB090_14030 [Petrimonas sp.]|nr:hypothetical protein [Petrimonas sp.]